MNLTNFRSAIRLYVPAAKVSRVSNTRLDVLINLGVDDVNIRALAYKGDKKFNVVADLAKYVWSEYIDDFAVMDESGIWWNDGDADDTEWRQMDAMTRNVLDKKFPLWKDDASDDPRRYFTESDMAMFHPTPSTALSNGFWAFYVKAAVAMTSGTHYPFTGTATEITSLRVLDDAIIDYVRWKLARPLGNDQKGILSERDYTKSLDERITMLRRRPDIMASKDNRMKCPVIG